MSKTIFIAEDNPTNMKLLKDILSFQGYSIIEASDGESAVKKILENREKINLVLMDIQLPLMSGLDVIKTLKAEDSAKHIPVFVISAYAMENDIKNAMDAGCINYITKPINIESFLKTINEFFENQLIKYFKICYLSL